MPIGAQKGRGSEFYVGYQPKAPAALGGWLRRTVLVLLIVGTIVAASLAILQGPFAASRFEFGIVKEFSGVVQASPYPILYATQPEARSYLLVAPGKHGSDEWLEGLDGRQVSLRGSLIYYQDSWMIEIQPDSIEVGEARAGETGAYETTAREVDLGQHTVRGEIVGSKCYLGVMKPGRQKTHRACAIRCISGGVPPMLLVETAAGEQSLLLLVDSQGRAVHQEVLPFVAEPVEISGSVRQRGDQLMFFADFSSLRRL